MSFKSLKYYFGKNFILIFFLATIQWVGNAQTPVSTEPTGKTRQPVFSVGVNGGIDYNFNVSYNGYYSQYTIKPNYNIGVDLGLRIGQRCRFRVEFKYGTIGYGRDYSYSTADLSPTSPMKSELMIYNWGFNLRFDYRLFSVSKLDVFITPALKYEYTNSDHEKTTRYNGTKSNLSYLEKDYDHSLRGAGAGMVLRYNITRHIGITVLPEYTYFFSKFYDKNSDNLQRFNANLGFEWRF